MKLHLGCGKVNIPGFVNVDLSDFPHVDYVSDIRTLPMFEDETVDLIYVSATFQYFDREEGRQCLEEWYRVLKKGGCIMISTVDFDKLLEVYKKTNDMSKIIGPLYGKMPVYDNFGNPSENIYHKTVYNYDDFRNLLEDVGYIDINKYDFRDTIHNKYDDQSQSFFPHMDKQNGIHIMQNIEAFKAKE